MEDDPEGRAGKLSGRGWRIHRTAVVASLRGEDIDELIGNKIYRILVRKCIELHIDDKRELLECGALRIIRGDDGKASCSFVAVLAVHEEEVIFRDQYSRFAGSINEQGERQRETRDSDRGRFSL